MISLPPKLRSNPLLAGVVVATAAVFSLPALVDGQTDDQKPPADWIVRADQAGADTDETFWVEMPPGWHITSGPAAIYFNPATKASGSFRVESEIFLFDPNGRREAFGVFVGGEALEASTQQYVYFLIRPTGEFLLKKRDGRDTPVLVNWTRHEAIVPWSAKGEDDATVTNVLAVDAGPTTVRFLVNDTEVATLPRSEVSVDGVVGLRVNHAVNIHVATLEVTTSESER